MKRNLITKINEYKKRVKPSEKLEDFADIYIEKISNSLGTKVVKKLSMGHFGIAYLTRKGTVIKVTSDKKEAINCFNLIGEKNKHLMNYYNVNKISLNNISRDESVFFIEMDYIKPFVDNKMYDNLSRYGELRKSNNLNKYKNYIWDSIKGVYFNDYYDYEVLKSKVKDEIDFITKPKWSDNNDDNKSYDIKINDIFDIILSQRDEFIEEGEKYNLNFMEAHSGNLGFTKDGNFTYYDIGFSDTIENIPNKGDIPVVDFDNEFSKVKDIIISDYKDGDKILIRDVILNISKSLNISKVKSWKLLRDEVYAYNTDIIYFTDMEDMYNDTSMPSIYDKEKYDVASKVKYLTYNHGYKYTNYSDYH